MNASFTVTLTLAAVLICYTHAVPANIEANPIQEAVEREQIQAILQEALKETAAQDNDDDSQLDTENIQLLLTNMRVRTKSS